MQTAKQIILIAGPSASGKSTLQDQIKNNRCPALCKQLGITPPSDWLFTSLRDLFNDNQLEQHNRLIIHCDLYNRGTWNRLESLLNQAPRIQALTLCTPQTVLRTRNAKRIRSELPRLLNPRTFRQARQKIRGRKTRQKWNQNIDTLRATYHRWFDLLDKHNTPSSSRIDATAIDNPVATPLGDNRDVLLKKLRSSKNIPTIGRIRRIFSKVWKQKTTPPPDTLCVLPWMHLHVQETGDVKLCCASKKSHILGNVQTDRILDLFHSSPMQQVRQSMLNGTIPPECKACFKIERTGSVSLRQFYNRSFTTRLERIEKGKEPPHLRALDLRISNACNLKCRSCSAASSSAWSADQRTLYPNRPVEPLITLEQSEPFKAQFTALLERGLDEIHLAGGEPLITGFNHQILDQLIESGQTKTTLYYDTNLTRLTHNGRNILTLWKHFDNLHISLSLDATGAQGEYIRHGLDYEQWSTHLRRLKQEVPHAALRLHMVLSVFNIATLPRHLERICAEAFVDPARIGFTFLSGPPHLCVQILPRHLKKKFTRTLRRHIVNNPAYSPNLRTDTKNLIRFMNAADRTDHLDEFRRTTALLDQSRNENAWELFPELRDILQAPAAPRFQPLEKSADA